MFITFEKVTKDPNIQVRMGISEDRIAEFADILDSLPPPKLVHTPDGRFVLADGWHRSEAASRKGKEGMDFEVIDGEYREALEIAAKSNCTGPLSMSREDKRRAISKYLEFFPERANSWIASDVGVAPQTVDAIRTDLEGQSVIPIQEKLVTRDSREYPRRTATPQVFIPDDDVDDAEITSSFSGVGRQTVTQQVASPEVLTESPPARTNQFEMNRKQRMSSGEKDFVGSSDGEVLAQVIGDDGFSALRIKRLDNVVVTVLYHYRGDKFYPAGPSVQMDVSRFSKFFEELKSKSESL